MLLDLFPNKIHPITLVSDPDRLMAGDAVMSELARRGFSIIQENDPVLLRHRVEAARPFTVQHPVVVITFGRLEALPFDLFQSGYRITVSLHEYFPNLAYPVLQQLNPDQVENLGSCPPPPGRLSRQKTIDYLLGAVFAADLAAFSQPHALIGWLNDYHRRQSPLPELLRTSLVERLKRYPIYQDWGIDLLIRDAQAFAGFVQQQWQYSIDQFVTGKSIQDSHPGYYLKFDRDTHLQDLAPALIRHGTLRPLELHDKKGLPAWSLPGIIITDVRLHRLSLLLDDIENRVKTLKSDPDQQPGWNFWIGLAQDWAELGSIYNQTDIDVSPAQKTAYRLLVREVDENFSAWLGNNYPRLGAQRLPQPHHVHHIPHYLAHLRSLGQIEKAVLLILDGLSYADWQVVKPAWAGRHANWDFKTIPVLAQIPTITAISRYALVSGLRPADFINELARQAPEARAWEVFWSREGVPETACKLLPLSFDRGIDQQPELHDPRVYFWCLIEDTLDKLAHNATLGAPDQQSILRLWLDPAQEQNSIAIENLLDAYLDRGFSVFIASDHGHVEATGFGQPAEGLLAQTRGKRARIYTDRRAALRVQDAFALTILWDNDGILPDGMAALMPSGRAAFTTSGELVVTHGGISIDEVIVPLIQITKASS